MEKAGVLLLGLVDQRHQQQTFLNPIDRERPNALMAAMDRVIQKHSRQVPRSGATGICERWRPLAERRSPR